jgi:hypothetical protein
MKEQDQSRYDELFERSKHELVQQVMEAEDSMTANDELMQVLYEIVELQDKIITKQEKELDGYMSGRPPFRKLVPKPVHTDEERLVELQRKFQNLIGDQG